MNNKIIQNQITEFGIFTSKNLIQSTLCGAIGSCVLLTYRQNKKVVQASE